MTTVFVWLHLCTSRQANHRLCSFLNAYHHLPDHKLLHDLFCLFCKQLNVYAPMQSCRWQSCSVQPFPMPIRIY
ncbi:hypothetical protein RIF29_37770 [Crotalaria pallida]|uniref:Uncharacterized protein n=1 Tax=Crotalaria pallida TaxID=3830 RepID=A0AAN9HRP5_CROPI